jgi:hypothetical protein
VRFQFGFTETKTGRRRLAFSPLDSHHIVSG